jgi:hypothetical protein
MTKLALPAEKKVDFYQLFTSMYGQQYKQHLKRL